MRCIGILFFSSKQTETNVDAIQVSQTVDSVKLVTVYNLESKLES